MSPQSNSPWSKRIFVAIVVLVAAVAGALVAGMPAWAASAAGVLIGLVAAGAMAWWDSRHAPDFVATFEAGLK